MLRVNECRLSDINSRRRRLNATTKSSFSKYIVRNANACIPSADFNGGVFHTAYNNINIANTLKFEQKINYEMTKHLHF